jgi:excisionase family DNA binding protein
MKDHDIEIRNDQPKLDELISLQEAAVLSGLSQPHLSLLIRQGKLWGKKIGRNWVTTEQAVREYLARDRKPGPKPQNTPEFPRNN